ncbi:MAG: LapA family protein [Parvibaculum sp.]|uniref:LapA family protein n=1 Tax=Parvibaculum sp. TaxID=2024848 RepID=UPI00284BA78C|nr:LapA family protein [Parvibaculum sp.]MDR3500337.1 LapA family protein [Parvibaculum sp.]
MKFMRWIVLPPLALIVMALAVANRGKVLISLDPFNPLSPALGFDMPLALVILIAVFVGILIGGVSTWRQVRRKAARGGKPLLPPM